MIMEGIAHSFPSGRSSLLGQRCHSMALLEADAHLVMYTHSALDEGNISQHIHHSPEHKLTVSLLPRARVVRMREKHT